MRLPVLFQAPLAVHYCTPRWPLICRLDIITHCPSAVLFVLMIRVHGMASSIDYHMACCIPHASLLHAMSVHTDMLCCVCRIIWPTVKMALMHIAVCSIPLTGGCLFLTWGITASTSMVTPMVTSHQRLMYSCHRVMDLGTSSSIPSCL